MRIIGGRWRSRVLRAPSGRTTRPLTDRIRESLANILGQDLAGERVVDCFAGGGSFGLECASRGAARVDFVERDPTALEALRRNVAALDDGETRLVVHAGDALAALPRLGEADLCFCDPPFAWFVDRRDDLAAILAGAWAILAPDGLLAVRGERGDELPDLPAGATVVDLRDYGRSRVALISASGA